MSGACWSRCSLRSRGLSLLLCNKLFVEIGKWSFNWLYSISMWFTVSCVFYFWRLAGYVAALVDPCYAKWNNFQGNFSHLWNQVHVVFPVTVFRVRALSSPNWRERQSALSSVVTRIFPSKHPGRNTIFGFTTMVTVVIGKRRSSTALSKWHFFVSPWTFFLSNLKSKRWRERFLDWFAATKDRACKKSLRNTSHFTWGDPPQKHTTIKLLLSAVIMWWTCYVRC